MREWKYKIQLMNDARRVHRPDTPELVTRTGVAWSLVRETRQSDNRDYLQTIITSPGVFGSDEEAKQDALRNLAILRCPIDRPIDAAIKWILDDE